MNFQALREYCLAKPGAYGDFPFDEVTWVCKVGGKMFALADMTQAPLRVNLKCDPDDALALRAQFPQHVLPGYHMNKRHWNTLVLDGTLSLTLVRRLIDQSYTLVARSLPRDRRPG